MAHVILGLLLIAPQSLYDLVKHFEAGVALFYSASTGSIKRALDGLAQRGEIEVASVEAGRRGRKVYRVTSSGRRAFHEWMTGELRGPDLEAIALPRLYFLGLIHPDDRGGVLSRIQARVEEDLGRLSTLEKRLATLAVPDEYRDLAASQRATLDYGIGSLRFARDWMRAYATRAET